MSSYRHVYIKSFLLLNKKRPSSEGAKKENEVSNYSVVESNATICMGL